MKKLTALFLALLMLLSLGTVAFASGSTINYVALGDSTAMGYYLDNYQTTYQHLNTNSSNFSSNYSDYVLFKSKLEDAGYTVNGSDLAMAGTRPSELRAILDRSYYNREATGTNFCNQHLTDWTGTEHDAYGSYDLLNQTYTEKLTAADIITYDLLMSDLGLYFLDRLKGLVNPAMQQYDSTPENETYLKLLQVEGCDEIAESTEALHTKLENILTQLGLDIGDNLISQLLDIALYTYAHFAINFSATMDLLYEMNPDVTLIVVGPHNPASNLSVEYNGIEINVGRLVDCLYEAITSYAVSEDDHADRYIFADCSAGGVNTFIDDFADGHFADEAYAYYRKEYFEDYLPGYSDDAAAASGLLAQLSQNVQSICSTSPLKVEDLLNIFAGNTEGLEDALLYGIDGGHTASPTSLGSTAAYYSLMTEVAGAGVHPGASGCLQKVEYIWQAYQRNAAAEHTYLVRIVTFVRTLVASLLGDKVSSDALQTLLTHTFTPIIRIRTLFR